MTMRPLPREVWNDYFDAFSQAKDDAGRIDYAVVRFLHERDGRPMETLRLPLQSLTYDPKDDLLEVVVPGLGHFIDHPKEIRLGEEGGRLRRVEVLRHDGTSDVVELS